MCARCGRVSFLLEPLTLKSQSKTDYLKYRRKISFKNEVKNQGR